MANNSNWFESPIPKPHCFGHPSNYRGENENNSDDDENWNKMEINEPLDHIHISKENLPTSQLSPWSKHLHHSDELEHRFDPFSLPEMFSHSDRKKQIIETPLIFSDDQEEEQPTTPPKNSLSAKSNSDEQEINTIGKKSQNENSTGRKSRPREKGLRKLSERAYEIVLDMKHATYKEVAAHLVKQLNDGKFDWDVKDVEVQSKQEQNVKRRVYDALNVLIALGVLRKDGRKIVSEKQGKKNKSYKEEKERMELQSLKQKLQIKCFVIREKLDKKKEAIQKYRAIQLLLDRNKSHSKEQKEKAIHFPFIGLQRLHPSQDKIILGDGKFNLQCECEDEIRPFGDMDSLNWLRQSLELNSNNKSPSNKSP